MSKTHRHESDTREAQRARINALRGFRPMNQRERDRLRESAFDALQRKH